MRFVNLHYAPDVASTGQHLTDLAEYLVARGVDVEVLTARGHYSGGQLAARRRETRNGVRVRRLPSPGLGRRWRLGRIIDYAAFYLQLVWIVCVGRRAAGTVFLTTPPLLGFAGWLGRQIRSSRYGIWSMDLHPEAEIAAGMLRPTSLPGRLLVWLNRLGYRAADFVVDLGPYMRRRILEQGVRPERLATVAIWGPAVTDGQAALRSPGSPASALRERWGVADKCVVMYAGNAGIAHDFDAVLDAMRRLAGDPSIHFVFIGGGPRRPEIEAFAKTHHLGNFSYHPYVGRADVGEMLAAGEIHLITLRAPFAGIAVPGKLYGIMGAARPALFVGPAACETADAIKAADAGVVIDPADGDAAERIVAAITRWRDEAPAARAAGARGLTAYRSHYQRAPNCAAFASVLATHWPDVCGAAVGLIAAGAA
jgi:colanic acid biosynthesis glycosyl transferase WcaI